MKNFVPVILAGACLCWAACAHRSGQPASHSQDSLSHQDSSQDVFFPVAEYLETQILRIDSFPEALRKFTTRNGRTDTAYIQLPEFNALAMQFLVPAFNDGSFQKQYTETSFMDRSTQSVTLTYSPRDKGLPLQRVDVVTIPENGVNKVRSVYLENSKVAGDSTIFQKLYWQTSHQLQIISLITVKGQPPVGQQVKVVWDPDEDNE
jgi:hypothetical protein